jgi:hypothetical protein
MQSDKYTILFLSSWYPTRLFPLRGDFVKRHAKAVGLGVKVVCLYIFKSQKFACDKVGYKYLKIYQEVLNV